MAVVVDWIEQSARVVESFVARRPEEAALLAEIARAIRDKTIAVDAHGVEQSARIVEAFAAGVLNVHYELLAEIAQAVRNQSMGVAP